jgi:hypothetical protein
MDPPSSMLQPYDSGANNSRKAKEKEGAHQLSLMEWMGIPGDSEISLLQSTVEDLPPVPAMYLFAYGKERMLD